MARPLTHTRLTKSDRIYEKLREHITSPDRSPGERVVPMRKLAKLLGASVFTVQWAMKNLEADGYVETRHGAGTFIASRYRPVTMADTVTLCMDARGHLWPDLVAMLMEALADRGRIGTLLGTELDRGDGELIGRMARSESDTMIVQAGGHFPFQVFDLPGMRRKTVIAAVSWASPRSWPGLYRVLHDREAGARLAAEHLRSRGHRKVLVLGTDSQVRQLEADVPDDICPAWPFRRKWERGGGKWTRLASLPAADGGHMKLDEDAVLAILGAPDAPRAVFGLRDHEAWLAQGILLRRRPELASRVDFVGYGNTPWSQASHHPFTTVDFNFEGIVEEIMGIIERVDGGAEPSESLVRVPPRLVVRQGA